MSATDPPEYAEANGGPADGVLLTSHCQRAASRQVFVTVASGSSVQSPHRHSLRCPDNSFQRSCTRRRVTRRGASALLPTGPGDRLQPDSSHWVG